MKRLEMMYMISFVRVLMLYWMRYRKNQRRKVTKTWDSACLTRAPFQYDNVFVLLAKLGHASLATHESFVLRFYEFQSLLVVF